MSVETKKVIDAIRKILTEVGKLSDEQLEQFIVGDLAFKFEVKKPGPVPKPPKPSLDFESLEKGLYNCTDTQQAISYLNDTKLTVTKLKEFAKHLKCSVFGAAKKDDVIKQIVNGTVRARADAAAISRT